MTTLREAAKQALEALKCLVETYEMQNTIRADINDAEDAINALKAALEQPEHKVTLKPVFYAPRKLSNEEVMAVIGPFRREQPEQDVPEKDCGNMEPVAWTTMPHTDDWLFVSGATKPSLPGEWRPLYTHSPRREWRGLSKDETMHLLNDTSGGEGWADEAHIQRFRRAVEAKLKERNP